MSNTSAVSSHTITLPKGGGALHGIGETFSPDLHTGTGNFTVPIALPPGRNGFQPDLLLVYSTGNGNGPFGLGWSLSIPGVSRKTAKGVPRYDASDVFILSSAEDLVPVEPVSATTTRYQPRTEGMFARILRHQGPADDYWEVHSKDGRSSIYGTPGRAGVDPAVVAHSDAARWRDVFAWKLTTTTDPFGNRIEYEYQRDAGAEPPHRWNQLYLRVLRYTDYIDAQNNRQYLFEVRFVYQRYPDPLDPSRIDLRDIRPDSFSEYRSGFEIRTRLRCSRIEIVAHDGQPRPIRTIEIDYLDERTDLADLAACLPPNRVSLLSRIRVIGYDDTGAPNAALPPLEFGYTCFMPDRRRLIPLVGEDLPARSLADPTLELVDLHGHGLPNMLELNGQPRYWRNLGNGRFARPRPMREAPADLTLADPGVQLIDADGDGRPDLLVTNDRLDSYFPLRFDPDEAGWDRGSFRAYRQAPSFSLQNPEVKLLDLDGDGAVDALRSAGRFECFFNDPQLGWSSPQPVFRRPLAEFPDVTLSDPRVKLADMTGDGLQDIVLVHEGSIVYWPNMGHGDWGGQIVMRASPRLPRRYDPRRVLLGDVDGDGLADLVYVDYDSVTLWVNCSGKGWSDSIRIAGTPPVTDTAEVRLVDMLGSGIAGLLWSVDARRALRHTLYFLDSTAGVKPYLLETMDNHIGAVTHVEYAPSTRYYLADQQRPETRWRTTLPFPVHVVARVTVGDAISRTRLTSEYRYHHGYWDGAEREFRGFGMVEQLDAEQADPRPASAPPTLTKTWFHLGPVGPEFGEWQELDCSVEYWPGDPPLLGHTPTVNGFLSGLASSTVPLTRRMQRDALRSLRGSILRSELYALDGTERAERPYTVREYAYGLREESPPQPDNEGRRRIFFPHLLRERTTEWERGDDPLSRFTFHDAYDQYGQPLQQSLVAPPRRRVGRRQVVHAGGAAATPDWTQMLATHTRIAYASPAQGSHIHDRPAQVTAYELTQPSDVVESAEGDTLPVLRDQAAAAAAIHATFRTLRPADVRVIGHTLNYYDGPAFVGLASGDAGHYGALTRSESLAFGDAVLDGAYAARRPAYLGGAAALPAGAPANFGTAFGYRDERQSGPPHQSGFYADTVRRQYDFQSPGAAGGRGLVVATQDPLGHQTVIDYERYGVLPSQVTDASGLVTRADYNYRAMQPAFVVDANSHTTRYTYTPLGLLQTIYLDGRNGEGGTPERPEIAYSYDLMSYDRTRDTARPRPIYVHSRVRVYHASEGRGDEVIEAREYSDGYGRVIQRRAQAEELVFGASGDDVGLLVGGQPRPGQGGDPAAGTRAQDRVLVSGWQLYDNKGRVTAKYEPFFASGWGYQPEAEARRGVRIELFYDPRNQLARTRNPDGSEQRVVFGVPLALSQPDQYTPSPWERYSYDPNDLAPLSLDPDGNALDAAAPAGHHFTPNSTVIDALGRVIAQVERNGPTPGTDWFLTRMSYDTRGNLRSVVDALGRQAARYDYDLLNRALQVSTIDGGVCTSVFDAVGNLVEQRDDKGAWVLREYDVLNRLVRLWARDDAQGARLSLREELSYGDGGDPLQPVAERAANRLRNCLGRLARHRDEAGELEYDRYDFKGNVAVKMRRVISDVAIAAGWLADWSAANSATAIDPSVEYRIDTNYDARNRPTRLVYPADSAGRRAVLGVRYNRAAAIERLELDGQAYVEQIAYNAKGQRVLIAYGNALMTRYAYDPRTFRLVRLRTERYAHPTGAPDTWAGQGPPLQDMTYTYDLVGNIVATEERVAGCGYDGGPDGHDALRRLFTYDPLYRLVAANGRACRQQSAGPPAFGQRSSCGFAVAQPGQPPTPVQANAPFLTEGYGETYSYDAVGNILRLVYSAVSQNWALNFEIGAPAPAQGQVPPNNRLRAVRHGSVTYSYGYDASGNLRGQNQDRIYAWDHADRMVGFDVRAAPGSPPSIEACYLYGADGSRVKKWVRTGAAGPGESTVYIDGLFEHYRDDRQGGMSNVRLHLLDGQRRIAMLRRGPAHPDDAGPAAQYHFGDHLDSSTVVVGGVDQTARDLVNREEYFPYGETSFGSFAKKRYRFSGKERDEESGLNYHGARYYAPWLARWTSVDPFFLKFSSAGNLTPAWDAERLNLYAYGRANPGNFSDATGLQNQKPPTVVTSPSNSRTLGTQAHADVLPELKRRINTLPEGYYQAEVEVQTLSGGSAKPGSWAPGETDLRVSTAGRGQHIYDLKPAGTSGNPAYARQVANYVLHQDTIMSAKPGTVLYELAKQHPALLEPVQVGNRTYQLSLPKEPGFLEYHVLEEFPVTRAPTVAYKPTLSPKPATPPGAGTEANAGLARVALRNLGSTAKFGIGVAGLAVSVTQNTPHYWESLYDTDSAELEYLFGSVLHGIGLTPEPKKPPHMGGDPAIYFKGTGKESMFRLTR